MLDCLESKITIFQKNFLVNLRKPKSIKIRESFEEVSKTLIYYPHPYTFYEKVAVERHNGLIRRFISKREMH